VLQAGELLIGQTTNILLFLGAKHKLAPRAEAGRLWANQLQLTIADIVARRMIRTTRSPPANIMKTRKRKPGRAPGISGAAHTQVPGLFEGVIQHNPGRGCRRRASKLCGFVAVPAD
jgi:glutathione S-transferase